MISIKIRMEFFMKVGKTLSYFYESRKNTWLNVAHLCLGIPQARILEWVAIPFSGGSSLPRDRIWVSCITIWATREDLNSSKEVTVIVVSRFFGPYIYYWVQTITWGNYTFHTLHSDKSQFQTIYDSLYVYNFHFCVQVPLFLTKVLYWDAWISWLLPWPTASRTWVTL